MKKILFVPQKMLIPGDCSGEEAIQTVMKHCEYISQRVCSFEKSDYRSFDRKIDKILTSKTFGIPIMLIFLGLIFWITIIGANYPSQILSNFFNYIQDKLLYLFNLSRQMYTHL